MLLHLVWDKDLCSLPSLNPGSRVCILLVPPASSTPARYVP